MKYSRPATNELPSPLKTFLLNCCERLYQWRFGVLVGLALVIMLYGLFIGPPLWELNDAADAPEQQGTATVLTRTVITRKQGPLFTISFQVGDRVAEKTVYDSQDWISTEVGARVRVKYRIGKSGKLYIDRWELPRRQRNAEER